MSRTFSKILVICALVVLLPLTVVGTAFAAYYSVDAVVNITIHTIGNADPQSTDAMAGVEYNGKVITTKKFQISQSHLDSITIEAKNVGYDFVGWFEGDDYAPEMQDSGNKLTEGVDGSKLTLKMEDGKSYVAVFEVIKYTLSWNYIVDPDTNFESKVYTQANPDAEHHEDNVYVYGEELPVLPLDKATEYNVPSDGGWCKYEGTDTNQPANYNRHYSKAEFKDESGKDLVEGKRTFALTYDWIEKGTILVNYYSSEDLNKVDGREAIVTEKVVKSTSTNYSYETRFESLVQEKEVDLDAVFGVGYTWSGFKTYINKVLTPVEEGDFSSADFTDLTTIDIFVDKEAIKYTAKIDNNSTQGADFNNAEGIKFDVTNLENVGTMFDSFFDETSYTKDYFFYEFKGIKVGDGELITSSSQIADALNTFVNEHKHETAELMFTAEFKTDYKASILQKIQYQVPDEGGIFLGSVYDSEGKALDDKQGVGVTSEITKTIDKFLSLGDVDKFYDSAETDSRKELVFDCLHFGANTVGEDWGENWKTKTVADLVQAMHDNGLASFYEIVDGTITLTGPQGYGGSYLIVMFKYAE